MHRANVLLLFVIPVAFCTYSLRFSEDDEMGLEDWSEAIQDGHTRVIDFLIVVDSSLTQHFNFDENKIRSATITLMHTVNMYLYPLNIRLAIADIVPIKGTNFTLDDFSAWKKMQSNFPKHNVAVLLRHNYEGGIATTGNVCSGQALAISGFFAEATMDNAWVFIHELAHVLGLTHDFRATCNCAAALPGQCLRIKGFEECSVQALLNILSKHKCLAENTKSRSSVPFCGNGLLERDEECDCGPQRYCDNIFCDAPRCQFILPQKFLVFLITFGCAFSLFLMILFTGKLSVISFKRMFDKAYKKPEQQHPVIESRAPTPILAVPRPVSSVYVAMHAPGRFWAEARNTSDHSLMNNL